MVDELYVLDGAREHVRKVYDTLRTELSQLCFPSGKENFDFPKNPPFRAHVWLGFSVFNEYGKLELHLHGEVGENEPFMIIVKKSAMGFNFRGPK